jgi:hypothetical protein
MRRIDRKQHLPDFEPLIAHSRLCALLGPEACHANNVAESELVPIGEPVFFAWDLASKSDMTAVARFSYTPEGGVTFEVIDPASMYVR